MTHYRRNHPSNSYYEPYTDEERDDLGRKVRNSLSTNILFNPKQCKEIEKRIDDVVNYANKGKYKRFTVDRSPLRCKYFFGEGYTYGNQLEEKGVGKERLYPHGCVDPIPTWIHELVEKPLVEAKLIDANFCNSVVINDYQAGGCIVSHIDPKHLFDRPIITVSFMSDSLLSFGCKFFFKPLRTSTPVYQLPLRRGGVSSISGYAADNITHCIRPQDTVARRAVIILRRVFPDAPRLDTKHIGKPTVDGRSDNSLRKRHHRYTDDDDDKRLREHRPPKKVTKYNEKMEGGTHKNINKLEDDERKNRKTSISQKSKVSDLESAKERIKSKMKNVKLSLWL